MAATVFFPYEQGSYQWTSPYGYRTDPLGGGTKFHGGVDLAPSRAGASPLTHSPVDGFVTVPAFEAGGAGNNVWVMDRDRVLWKVFHLARIDVRTGQEVKAGDVLGLMGTTGASTGVHGHVERWEGGPYGTRTDPTPALKEAEAAGRFPGAPIYAEEPLVVTNGDKEIIRLIVREELAKAITPTADEQWMGTFLAEDRIYIVNHGVKYHVPGELQPSLPLLEAAGFDNRGVQDALLAALPTAPWNGAVV